MQKSQAQLILKKLNDIKIMEEMEEGEWNDQTQLNQTQRVWHATNFGQVAELEEILQQDDVGNLVEGIARPEDDDEDDEILVSLLKAIDATSFLYVMM